MKCAICGVDTGMHALSTKPDPGWGYNTHTWEQCARQLLTEAAEGGALDLKPRILLLLRTQVEWKTCVHKAISELQSALK